MYIGMGSDKTSNTQPAASPGRYRQFCEHSTVRKDFVIIKLIEIGH